MATAPVPQWAQEMSPYFRGVSGRTVLTLAVVGVGVGLLFRVAGAVPAATAPFPTTVARVKPITTVEGPACAELARLKRHHVTSGPSYARAAGACQEERSDGR